MVHKTDSKKEFMELTLPQAIDYYGLDAGKSPETILWHRKKLTAFATFLQNGGEPPKIYSLAIEDGRT